MNKFALVLSSIVDGATVSVQVLVNSDMTAKQLRTFYLCSHSKVSNIYVEEIK